MKDYSYELLDLLEKYKGDAEAALRGETSPWCLYAFSPLRGVQGDGDMEACLACR